MKDPAFLFYPNDWIGGTMGMTFEEKGAYIELLMMQFNRGHMTSHMIGQTVGQLWDKVQDKFKIDSEGLYFNERLDIEKDKRKAFTESRRNNINGENQYTKKGGHLNGHMTSHMEDGNEIVNVDKNKKFKIPEIEEITKYCQERKNSVNPQKFLNHYISNGWMVGKNKMKDWKAAIRTWENSQYNLSINQKQELSR
jgi:uncharacterized protein YdaU (DUF1376 family)